MDPVAIINERVDVAVTYRKDGGTVGLARPVRMVYRGQMIEFVRLGLRHPTIQGKRMIHVFDMSDGNNDYRLEFDAEHLTWTLVSMLAGDHYV